MSVLHSEKTKSVEVSIYSKLVESYLGKRAAVVIETLISYGRLTVKEINKLSELPSVLIKKTLVSLLQLGCVSIWEEKSLKGDTTYYSFREDGALTLLYSGEIIAHVDQVYKEDRITQIIHTSLSLGSLSVGDYLSAFKTDDKEVKSEVERFFTLLVNDKYLIPVQKPHFNPIKDVWDSTYKKAYAQLPKNTTVSELKRVAEAKGKARINFLNILNYQPEILYIKDKLTSTMKINSNLPLCFNIERFLKARRSLQLVQFCSHKLGKITSIIYEKALLATETNSPSVINPMFKIGLTNEEINKQSDYEPKSSNMFSAKDVLKHLPKDFSLADTVLSGPPKRKNENGNSQGSKRLKLSSGYAASQSGVDEENYDVNDDDDDDNDEFNDVSHMTIIDSHLRILVGSAVPFLRRSTNGLYYVPFPDLIPYLRKNVHDYVLSSTLGAPAARILRCVRDNRLVSEKSISSSALLKEKDARSLTSTLVKFNFLQIQEIPKSADRAASKTVFLFRVNERHGNDFLKSNICWNMGQTLAKIDDLRQENSALIAKINRDDVKGREMELLLPSELTQLKTLNEKELNLTIRFHRLISIWEVFKFFI